MFFFSITSNQVQCLCNVKCESIRWFRTNLLKLPSTSCQDFGYVVMSQLYSHVSIMKGGIKQTGTKTERE